MAETVIRSRHLVVCAALWLAQAAASAQSLQDPTRPPAMPTATEASGAPAAGPQLQSVLISRQPGGRHVAVIDGETVRLGEEYMGARVARITPNAVELVRGKDRQVLRLPSADEPGPAVKTVARLQ
jgi:MSHA biogenesis protein MshK